MSGTFPGINGILRHSEHVMKDNRNNKILSQKGMRKERFKKGLESNEAMDK